MGGGGGGGGGRREEKEKGSKGTRYAWGTIVTDNRCFVVRSVKSPSRSLFLRGKNGANGSMGTRRIVFRFLFISLRSHASVFAFLLLPDYCGWG